MPTYPVNGDVDPGGGGSITLPLSIANGGTGQTTGPAALRALAGSQALTISAGAVAIDCSLGLYCTLTVSANCTISNPTNASAGDVLTIVFTQDGTGGFWVDFGSAFEKPAVWTGANQVTTHRWVYDGTTWRVTSRALARRIGSDTSESAGSGTAATGSAFVPVPNAVYKWSALPICNSAATSTGAQPGAAAGTSNSGSIVGYGRAGGDTATVARVRYISGTTAMYLPQTSTESTSFPDGSTLFGHLIGASSSPGTFQLYIKSEVPGSQVTMTGNTVFEILRVS